MTGHICLYALADDVDDAYDAPGDDVTEDEHSNDYSDRPTYYNHSSNI